MSGRVRDAGRTGWNGKRYMNRIVEIPSKAEVAARISKEGGKEHRKKEKA